MLKDSRIDINISYRNKTHYIKLGYEPIIGKKLSIKTIDLPSSSHVIIVAICEICQSENKIKYDKYINNRKRHNFYSCKKCSRHKAALSSIQKYGVDNYSKTAEYKKRVEETNMIKYGYKTNLISPEYQKRIKKKLKDKYGTENWYEVRNGNGSRKNNFLLSEDVFNIMSEISFSEDRYDEKLVTNDYLLYRTECRKHTNKSYKVLLENWDGLDYYDNELIKNNFILEHNNPNYPTIDHKMSIYHGFINGISPEEISNISNLCITKRSINSSKRDLIESEFLK